VQIWSQSRADEWILEQAWLRLRHDRRIRPEVPAQAFEGGYDRGGDVAANMVEFYLTELTSRPISTGLIRVTKVWPPDAAPSQVFQGLVRATGSGPVGCPEANGYFCDTYDAILLLLAWCLSCEWEVDFVAAEQRFALSCEEDGRVTVFWAEGESVVLSAYEALMNIDYVPVWGTTKPPSSVPPDGQ
jgi:hypothetical protein